MSRTTDWVHIFRGTLCRAYFNTFTSDYQPHFRGYNATHSQYIGDLPRLSYGDWHHFVITYEANSGFEVFVDGCIPPSRTRITNAENLVIANDFEMGCEGGNKCSQISFDDLRFWTAKKSPLFIWRLWKIYN